MIILQIKLNKIISDVRNREVFRESAYRRSVRQIAAYIGTGSNGFENIIMESSPIEVAAALQYFLIRLPRPILPTYIQALALGTLKCSFFLHNITLIFKYT